MIRRISYALVIILISSAIYAAPCKADDLEDLNEGLEDIGVLSEQQQKKDAQRLSVDAAAAIAMESKSGRVLFEKNARTRMPMASTTKIMTAILALENGKLSDRVNVSKRAAQIGGSTAGLRAGEDYSLEAMLYCLMLVSGNDAAIAIAEHVGGTVEAFVERMNRKAMEIGAVDTSFGSPHGLDRDDHFSTAYDLALMTRYGMKNADFSRIVATGKMSIEGKNLYSTNEMLRLYEGANGVKTGYTGKAGRCLVTSAKRGGMQVFTVVLGCPTRNVRAKSSAAMLNDAFDRYRNYSLVNDGEFLDTVKVIHGEEDYVRLTAMEAIILPLTAEEASSLKRRIILPRKLSAPVGANVEVGRVEYVLNGKTLAQTALKTREEVRKKSAVDYFADILFRWIGVICLQV